MHDTLPAITRDQLADIMFGTVFLFIGLAACAFAAVRRREEVRLFLWLGTWSAMFGLGYALAEEVRFRGREILDHNFDSYEIPRFSWLPRIETVLVDNPEVPASGCGEPPIVNMGAVLANAIYDAVGARLLQLPMTPARVKAAFQRS